MNGLNRLLRMVCMFSSVVVLIADTDKQRAMLFGIFINVVAISVTAAFDK